MAEEAQAPLVVEEVLTPLVSEAMRAQGPSGGHAAFTLPLCTEQGASNVHPLSLPKAHLAPLHLPWHGGATTTVARWSRRPRI